MRHAAVLHAISDPTRRKILAALKGSPRPVGELAAGLPVSQPAVSQHLAVLHEAGLVSRRREGRQRIYALRPRGFEPLRRYVASFWDEPLQAYRHSFEPTEDGR